MNVYFASVENRGSEALCQEYAYRQPCLLVSYEYIDIVYPFFGRMKIRYWALDSGAFSAFSSGSTVTLAGYMDCIRRLRDTPYPPDIHFALDEIGDWQRSKRNTELMWAKGFEAIPTFHVGEPWDLLVGYARDYPRIALGGVARLRGRGKLDFAKECFSRVWPKHVHGLGFSPTISNLTTVPFHSIDATSWQMGPLIFSNFSVAYKGLKNRHVAPHVAAATLKRHVEHGLKMEQLADAYWKREYEELRCLSPSVVA